MKYLSHIWPFIILMMIAPVKDAMSISVADINDDHDLNRMELSEFKAQGSSGSFTVNGNTYISIKKQTSLSIKNNLQLHSPVTGQGVVILNGDGKLSIDANGNSITNLIIRNESGVELKSPLKISQELSVEEGNLYLNEFNLVLGHSYVKIKTENGGGIAFNGSGRIIGQALQPMANSGPHHDRNFSSQAYASLLANQNPIFSGTQIYYHINQDCHSAVLCPPTPPPD